ncbi:MAG: COX15/CtaA family protein [Alphaproteobacteria bacterium]
MSRQPAVPHSALWAHASDRADIADNRRVMIWLFVVAALVFVMVIVGGATRLTDSGLSITEWRPVTGVLPPLTEAQWQVEFEKYRQIPQYQLVNRGMSLADFQVIFWWEWAHRLLGRVIGAAMLLPWLFFVATGVLRGRMAVITFSIGLMIAFQGLVGWLMVASGLKPGMTAVAPLKLMFHLTLACLIFACLIATALSLRPARARAPLPGVVKIGGIAVGVALIAQIMLGALVAGNDAGLRYNDWPLMEGYIVPPAAHLFDKPSVIEAFFDSIALTQFNHRLGAYALLALTLWHAWRASGTAAQTGARVLAGLMIAQAVIGIITLMWVVPLAAGLLHQAFALVVLGHAVSHGHSLMTSPTEERLAEGVPLAAE